VAARDTPAAEPPGRQAARRHFRLARTRPPGKDDRVAAATGLSTAPGTPTNAPQSHPVVTGNRTQPAGDPHPWFRRGGRRDVGVYAAGVGRRMLAGTGGDRVAIRHDPTKKEEL